MKAVILAGGLGTRMHPLTIDIPKPMLPFANKPIIEHTVELLKKNSITDIVMLLYHQPDIIKNHFGDGSKFGVNITYFVAPQNFGTAGAVKFAEAIIDETFLVISADVVTDFDLQKIIEFHNSKKALVTITLTRVENPIPYGLVVTDNDGRIKHFIEKPSWGEVITDTVNTGIYVINPLVLKEISEGREIDFSKDLFPKLLEKREPVYGYIAEGYWNDIGGLSEYGMSHRDIVMGKIMHDVKRIGENVQISPTAIIQGLVIIGEGSVIGDDVFLENAVLGKGCHVARGTKISESILWDNVNVGKDVIVDRAVVANSSIIGDRALLEEGCVVANNCVCGPDVHIKPYVKVWPGKKIEEGSIVSSSIVWRERWTKSIFGAYGVTGLCNIEITPEFAATLGAAYGVMIGNGAQITTSRDPHKSSRMIYRALLSGILSAGVNVSDLEMVPIPINRYELKAMKSGGGFHVRKSPFDPQVTDIKFFDHNGMDLSPSKEKQIERMFFGEDFKRVPMDDIGELSFPFYKVAEQYKNGFLSYVDVNTISERRIKFVIDYAHGSASQIFPAILGELKCDVVALNAHIDPSKLTKNKEEFDISLRQLSLTVKNLGSEFGVMLDAGAEKIFLVDEKGRLLSGDETLSLMSYLTLKHNGKKVIATPVTSSRVIEEIAKNFRGRVIRTKTTARALMEAAADNDVSFVGERLGGLIYPKFQVSFDGMISIAKLLEYLSKEGRSISEIIDGLPKSIIVKREACCQNNNKGKVMRALIEENGHNPVELIDGVKIYHKKDWVLVLPHTNTPSIRLEAEASDEDTAKKMLDQYAEKIENLCLQKGE
jgi:mannose-1-phosphate guanylyltransferase / phosphomannomutase